MRFRRVILALLVAISFASFGIDLDAAKGSKGSGHSTKSVSGPKTVHVKEYTKKDGTKVAAHDRKAPEQHATATKAEKPRKESTVSQPAAVARDERGRIQRSAAARHSFARQTGYPSGRPGYVIDHIKPLACGGADDPSNMQWQTIEAAKAKDRVERVGC
jgi:hypothetical protein